MNASPYHRVEHVVRVDGPSSFHVVVRFVNVSGPVFLGRPSRVVKFSESQYAIPDSEHIKLRTAAYYREWEESNRCGIGDSEEATLRRGTDFATFQREAGQTPLLGADNIRTSVKYTKECWIFCTSIAQSSATGMNRMQERVCRGYDATTLIVDPFQFAKQLGIQLGNTLQASDLKGPSQTLWTVRPQVFIDHGPVTYTESPSDVIERFPKASWGLITPFVKRVRFSDQKEYRFAISVWGEGGPKEPTLDLIISEELRALTGLTE